MPRRVAIAPKLLLPGGSAAARRLIVSLPWMPRAPGSRFRFGFHQQTKEALVHSTVGRPNDSHSGKRADSLEEIDTPFEPHWLRDRPCSPKSGGGPHVIHGSREVPAKQRPPMRLHVRQPMAWSLRLIGPTREQRASAPLLRSAALWGQPAEVDRSSRPRAKLPMTRPGRALRRRARSWGTPMGSPVLSAPAATARYCWGSMQRERVCT